MKLFISSYKLPPYASVANQLVDCLNAMKYILKHAKSLDIDLNRVVLAGDSEGGHLAVSLSQKLYETERFVPKLQVLIYPSVQKFNLLLPSSLLYETGLVGASNIYSGQLVIIFILDNRWLILIMGEAISIAKKFEFLINSNSGRHNLFSGENVSNLWHNVRTSLK